MAASDYKVGTVSIEAGSRTLVGDGTAWITANFQEGDTLFLKGYAIPLDSVDAEGEATLSEDWPGATVTDAAYRLRWLPDLSRMTAKTQALIDGLADNQGDPGAPGANFDPDAIGLFADRGDYDDEAEDFSYLSTDGDGDAITSAVIFIRVGAGGGWSAPIPFQGPAGKSIEVQEDGVSKGEPDIVNFADHFEIFETAPGTLRVRLKSASIIQLINTELGSAVWQLGGDGGIPPNVVTHLGVPVTHNGVFVTHTEI